MLSKQLLEASIYVDRSFVADLYEVVAGISPNTTIAKNQGKRAGATIPLFSAEVSAEETRSYSVSTTEMLSQVLPALEDYPTIDGTDLRPGMTSRIGWIEGNLTVFRASTTVRRQNGEFQTLAEDQFFQIQQKDGLALALITSPAYFALGLDAFLRMQQTLLKQMDLPVRACVRVLAAETHMNQWVAVPLVIQETGHAT